MSRLFTRRPFWIANLFLLLLYFWTLTASTSFEIVVSGGQCTAVFSRRTSAIPCNAFTNGFDVGVYQRERPLSPLRQGPLDWLAPRAAWRSVTLWPDGGEPITLLGSRPMPGWRRLLDEWRPQQAETAMRWPVRLQGDFRITARLRRAAEPAGILLFDTASDWGVAFISEPSTRRGAWWIWDDGELKELLVGIPTQKSLLSQSQSLLRRILIAHQGGLILLALGWLLARIFSRRRPRLRLPRLSTRTLLPALMAITFLISWTIAAGVLDRIPHVQDDIAYLFQAQTLARGKLWAPAPPVPEAFAQEFLLVQDGRWYGKYPPGYPLLLALGVIFDRAWLVNPILAALTIPILFALGRALYDERTGLLAAGLAAVSPFFLFMSGSMMIHTVELFWAALFMYAWVRALGSPGRLRWVGAAGTALGMLFLTRQITAVVVAAPVVGISLLAYLQREGQSAAHPLARQTVTLLTFALPFGLLLLAYQWALTGSPFRDPRLEYWSFDRPGFSADVGLPYNAFITEEGDEGPVVAWFMDETQPPIGHTPARGIYNSEANWRELEERLFGWPAALTVAFVWLAFLLRRPRWPDLMLLSLGAVLVAVYVTFWASGIMYGPRYYYAALPAFLLLTARGVTGLRDWLGGPAGHNAALVLLGILISGSLISYLPASIPNYQDYNFISRSDRDHIEARLNGPAVVFVENDPDEWWDYGAFFTGNTPWLDGRVIYARDLGDERNQDLRRTLPDRRAYLWHNGRLSPYASD